MSSSRVTYTVDVARRLVETTIRAGFTYAEMAAFFTALRADSRIQPEFDRIAIYEASAAHLTAEQIREMVQAARAVPHGPTTRVALVVPDDVTFGLMRMYELYGNGASVRVFRDRAEADAWLSERAREE